MCGVWTSLSEIKVMYVCMYVISNSVKINRMFEIQGGNYCFQQAQVY